LRLNNFQQQQQKTIIKLKIVVEISSRHEDVRATNAFFWFLKHINGRNVYLCVQKYHTIDDRNLCERGLLNTTTETPQKATTTSKAAKDEREGGRNKTVRRSSLEK